MWQLILAAAIAGSTGFIAKHLLNHDKEDQLPTQPSFDSTFATPQVVNDSNFELQSNNDGIFRFSSSSPSSLSGNHNRNSRNKSLIKGRRLKFGTENNKESNNQRSSGYEGGSRRFGVCLKKRRTAKTLPSKCGSRSSHDKTSFDRGLGAGIMYMMSAGKAEIRKLSDAMDETSKVVQELRTELYKRKSAKAAASSLDISCEHIQQVQYSSGSGDRDPKDVRVLLVPMIDDVECLSSVLTEEPDPQALEMDQLEAELASELQKLPWSDTGTSGHEEIEPTMGKSEISCHEILKLECQSNVSYQCQGVLPSELDKKLCHLLIEQQENQIEELESELHMAQSKLNDKDAELQALKDCVRRLTEFSLSTVSDDADEELEVQVEQDGIRWGNNNKNGYESEMIKSAVGMKRPIGYA
ncbi:uncharacterized protein LOC126676316 [Mercurialis annua]|uniref:uncharacterized protein LOC126676316 n=1 Tax=Mercurialis annua TaxID=3986 RepID=UPI0021602CE5|nr:uncharacterized protein LOC126676316 [Mercurialis annua]